MTLTKKTTHEQIIISVRKALKEMTRKTTTEYLQKSKLKFSLTGKNLQIHRSKTSKRWKQKIFHEKMKQNPVMLQKTHPKQMYGNPKRNESISYEKVLPSLQILDKQTN